MHKQVLTLGALTTLLAGTATAQIDVAPAVEVAVGSQPSGVAAGDFDGDGDMDLATTVDGPDRVVVLLNDGAGVMTLGPATILPNSSSPEDVASLDFDGDGAMDLAVALRDPSGAVIFLRNTGGGTFTSSGTVGVGERPRGFAVSDFDNDGDWDLAVAARDGNSASVLTNNGGTFTAQTLATGVEPRKAAFGDFDGDGDQDLAVTNHDSRTVGIYTNNGGSFALSATLNVPQNMSPEGIDATDIDGDGDTDLVTAASNGGAGVVTVFANNGGTFGGGVSYEAGGLNSSQVVAGDFDCDGSMDVAVTNSDSSNATFLRNTGGTLALAATITTGPNPSEIVAADLDGDGDLEVAIANGDGSTISVIQNNGCEGGGGGDECTADINNDGFVDVNDLLILFAQWGACPV